VVLIGVIYSRRTRNVGDFYLGGRRLGPLVTAMSAEASDMSSWLLMGLPGAVYALGTGQIWIAVGLFIGTALNWIFVAKRLRRYTIRANNSLTLPKYLENRFHDKHRILLLISSVAILIFFLVYTASGLAAGGKLFNSVFGFDYKICLTIGTAVILSYTFMGGFMAVCVTDFIQGLLMLIGVITVPIIAFMLVGAGNVMDNITASGVDSKAFFDILSDADGNSYSFVDIVSQLGWALGYFGMPHIIVRFMAIKNEKEIKKSRVIGIGWCGLSLLFACFIGIFPVSTQYRPSPSGRVTVY
jgi:sodium/proline symporter